MIQFYFIIVVGLTSWVNNFQFSYEIGAIKKSSRKFQKTSSKTILEKFRERIQVLVVIHVLSIALYISIFQDYNVKVQVRERHLLRCSALLLNNLDQLVHWSSIKIRINPEIFLLLFQSPWNHYRQIIRRKDTILENNNRIFSVTKLHVFNTQENSETTSLSVFVYDQEIEKENRLSVKIQGESF